MPESLKNPRTWLYPTVVSSMLVLAAGLFSVILMQPGACTGSGFLLDYRGEWYANWDGQWYKQILLHGYDYKNNDPAAHGPKVFFPLYPLLARSIYALTPLSPEWSMLAVTFVSLALLSAVWLRYAELRFPGEKVRVQYALYFLLFWPLAYILRMAYTESLFMLLCALMFYGMAKRWNIGWLIIISGLACATRPTGIICALTLGVYTWRQYASHPQRMALSVGAACIACWGLFTYMLYQWVAFGDPLFFVRQQAAWGMTPLLDRLPQVFGFQPLWKIFTQPELHTMNGYLRELYKKGFWLLPVLLLLLPASLKKLTVEERVFSFAMLAFVYVMASHNDMAGAGRYAFTVLPLFIVIAQLLPSRPSRIGFLLLAASGTLMLVYTSMFARWDCVR